MRLTIAQLEAFYWTAKSGSVQSAARHLHLSQPTVSLRLRDLETILGAQLFERAGRGIRPTPNGLSLLTRAENVLGEVARIREKSGHAEVSGSVRVGFAEGFAMVCLAPLVSALRRDYPALHPEFVVTTSSHLERDLAEHQIDMAFLVNPIGHDGMRLIPLGVQATSWIAATVWGLGSKVRPSDLRHIPIITNPPPSAMYRQIMNWFASGGLEPMRLDICTSVAVSAHLVATGVAVGVMPVRMSERYLAEGSVTLLDSDPPVDDGRVYAAYREGAENNAIEAIIASLRGVAASMNYWS
jgi:DNA-binding transcriptional LysR family regulator